VLRVEIELVDRARQVLRKVDLPLDERLVDDELCLNPRKLRFAPALHLLRHRPEIPLHVRDADFKCMDQIQMLAVLREHRRENAWDNISKLLDVKGSTSQTV
jgi:hypothetical protein